MQELERRQHPRLPFFAEVRVVGRAETYYHPANDISLGGAFLRTEFPLKIGTRVIVELKAPGQREPLMLSGAVTWVQDGAQPGTPEALAQPPLQSGMGIAFHPMPDADRKRLRQLIALTSRD